MDDWIGARGTVLRLVIGTALLPLVWHVWVLITVGELLPSTLSAKLAQSNSQQVGLYRDYVVDAVHTALFGRWWLGAFAVLGALVSWRVFWPLVVFWISHVLGYIILNAPNYAWYNYDTYMVVRLLLFVGISYPLHRILRFLSGKLLAFVASQLGKGRGDIGWAKTLAGGVGPALVLVGLPAMIDLLPGFWPPTGQLVQIEPYRRVAEFVRNDETASDKVLVSPEIGLLSFSLPQVEIRDTNGLATPDVTASRMFEWQRPYELYNQLYMVPMFNHWGEVVSFPTRHGEVVTYRREFIAKPDAVAGVRHAPVYVRTNEPALAPLSVPVHLKFILHSKDDERLSLDWGLAEIGAWTTGYSRRLILPLDSTISDYEIAFVVYPMVQPPIGSQRVVVRQGGMEVYRASMAEASPKRHVFKGIDGVDRIDLIFETPDAVVPVAVGAGPSNSRIALMLMELEVRSTGMSGG